MNASAEGTVRVIDLSEAPGERASWNRPVWQVLLWSVVELLAVSNPWQISSAIRVAALRAFGASIGKGVIYRPRTRVRFPWKLRIGDNCWIGEGVWLHNQDWITIGDNVVVSQETFMSTGSHAHRRDMALITRPISVEDGAWITSRCMILGGAQIGRSALVRPMTVVTGRVPSNAVVGGTEPKIVGRRFPDEAVGDCD